MSDRPHCTLAQLAENGKRVTVTGSVLARIGRIAEMICLRIRRMKWFISFSYETWKQCAPKCSNAESMRKESMVWCFGSSRLARFTSIDFGRSVSQFESKLSTLIASNHESFHRTNCQLFSLQMTTTNDGDSWIHLRPETEERWNRKIRKCKCCFNAKVENKTS